MTYNDYVWEAPQEERAAEVLPVARLILVVADPRLEHS